MKSFLTLSGLLTLCVVKEINGIDSPIWPQPDYVSLGSSILKLDKSFTFTTDNSIQSDSSSLLIRAAVKRYLRLIDVPSNADGSIKSCELIILDSSNSTFSKFHEVVGKDESYQLKVLDSGSCSIYSQTEFGALRGLETFSQLLTRDRTNDVLLSGVPINISDQPRFSHRGMMIDTSRHFLPVDQILSLIDSFPYSKFNVLHWHIVDAISFPLNPPSAPTMQNGAFSPDAVVSILQ